MTLAPLILAALTASPMAWGTGVHYRHHPGLECVQKYLTASRPHYYSINAQNDSTDSTRAEFYCPLRAHEEIKTQDPVTEARISESSSDQEIRAVVYVDDKSSASGDNGKVTCVLKACTDDFASCTSSSSESSTSGAGGEQALAALGFVSFASLTSNSAHIKCEIPGKTGGGVRSGVMSYEVTTTLD
jgi:hypothetical protein